MQTKVTLRPALGLKMDSHLDSKECSMGLGFKQLRRGHN